MRQLTLNPSGTLPTFCSSTVAWSEARNLAFQFHTGARVRADAEDVSRSRDVVSDPGRPGASASRGEIGWPAKRSTGKNSTRPSGAAGRTALNTRSPGADGRNSGLATCSVTNPPLTRCSSVTLCPGRTGETRIVIARGAPGDAAA